MTVRKEQRIEFGFAPPPSPPKKKVDLSGYLKCEATQVTEVIV